MANITDIAEANKMIDDLKTSLANKTQEYTNLQTKHSDMITANGKLVKEKAELWELVSTGKPAPHSQNDQPDKPKSIDLDEMDM